MTAFNGTQAVFTARRYTSAVHAVVVCPSVRHKPVLYRKEWKNRAGFGKESFPVLLTLWSGNSSSFKIRVLLPRNFAANFLDLENFAKTSRSCCRQSSSTVGLVDNTCTTVVARYCTSVDRNSLTSLLRSVAALLYSVFLQLCLSWQDFDRHSASRGPSAVAELLVTMNNSIK